MNRTLNTLGLIVTLPVALYAGHEVVTTIFQPWYTFGCVVAFIFSVFSLVWFMKERGDGGVIDRLGKFLWRKL